MSCASFSHILYEAIPRFIASGIGGAHSKTMKIYELVSISDKWIASQFFWTMDGWRYVSITGDDNKFRARRGCNDILIIFVQESSNNVNSNYNYFRLLLRIIGE